MNRPESFLHVVGGKEVRHSSKLVQQSIFETEDRSRTHDGGFREQLASYLFSDAL